MKGWTIMKYTALYIRSCSDNPEQIENQLDELKHYVVSHHFKNVVIYKDKGWSGVRRQGPAFKHMMKNVRDGRIKTIIVTDTSRISRDYIKVDSFIHRTVPECKVRFIAIHNGIDTRKSEPEMKPFTELFQNKGVKNLR